LKEADLNLTTKKGLPLTSLRLGNILKRLGFANIRRPGIDSGYLAYETGLDPSHTFAYDEFYDRSNEDDYLTRMAKALKAEGIASSITARNGQKVLKVKVVPYE
jgi:hypothetical protein